MSSTFPKGFDRPIENEVGEGKQDPVTLNARPSPELVVQNHEMAKESPSMSTRDCEVGTTYNPAPSIESMPSNFLARFQRLAGRLHVEQRGIERVPEDERHEKGTKAMLNVASLV